jgi:hypothetical protein
MNDANEMVAQYIAAWNERDAQKRRDLIARTCTEDAPTSTLIQAATDTTASTR